MSTAITEPTRTITLCKSGNLLTVSAFGGKDALPSHLKQIIEPLLCYTKKELLYGADRYDDMTGLMINKVKTQDRRCYRYDTCGRLITNFGMVYRLAKSLKEAGYELDIRETVEERVRPDCYDYDINKVLRYFKFRERQEECLHAILTRPCGIVHAVTGFGKLVMIAMVCLAFPHAKIDIVTRRATLVNKINNYLTRYIANVGQVGGGIRTEGRVTVYTAGSLHHSKFDADIVLADEAHELAAEKSSEHLARYRSARMFGFTASPRGRIDGTDIRLEALFGRTIFYISYQEAVELGLVVPIRVEWSDVYLKTNPCAGLEDVPKKRWGLWQNDERNQLIANKAKTFSDDDQVLILVETIEHAVHLRKFLPDYALVYDQMETDDWRSYIRAGLINPNEVQMTPERKEAMRVAFEKGELRKAIATKIWSVGIDPAGLTAVIRADASASEIMDIQAPGRVCRTHSASGKQVGIVCDFRDQFDTTFFNKAKRRYSHYVSMGWDNVLTLPDGSIVPME
jgi:superfamily II DNA or RNA helicase